MNKSTTKGSSGKVPASSEIPLHCEQHSDLQTSCRIARLSKEKIILLPRSTGKKDPALARKISKWCWDLN